MRIHVAVTFSVVVTVALTFSIKVTMALIVAMKMINEYDCFAVRSSDEDDQ